MNRSLPIATSVAAFFLGGCMVGPQYKRPAASTPPSFKESMPAQTGETIGWKAGHPGDQRLRNDWWQMYQDCELDILEAQVNRANQTLKVAEANFRASRAAIGRARSREAPAIGVSPRLRAVRESANEPYFLTNLANNGTGDFILPIDLNYEIDLWGRIRRGVTAVREEAEASAADMENVRISLHAELAMDYFGLRSADGQQKLLDDTIKAYEGGLQLTHERFDGGLAIRADVTQAQAQLEKARVQRSEIEVERSQFEHAIAVLIGKPPVELTIPYHPINIWGPQIPAVPPILPSDLLERRPDIAAYERRMAAANEEIGIAKVAYYPSVSINGLMGAEGTSALNWFTWPSRFWAVGPAFSDMLFDAGRRRSVSERALASYDATVADYRQITLSAFQQVEDNLAALRVLQREAEQQHHATDAALQTLQTFNERYEGGLDLYLQVISSQTTALANQRNDIEIMRRQLDASVLLIKALGGGWDTQQLPRL